MAAARVSVVYYSMYGHVGALCKAVAEGLKDAGVHVRVFRIAETLPQDVLAKMHAPPPDATIPVLDPTSDWDKDCDGVIFGLPTRYGSMAAQAKAFFDATGSKWSSGALQGKFAGTVTSTATQNGGQETTHLTAITQFAHHGMVYVPGGYCYPPLQFNNDYVHGGSPYGPSTIAGGDGSRKPLPEELAHCKVYATKFAGIVKAHVAGTAALAAAAK